MAAKFELHTSSNGQVHFNLKAANGKIVLTSQRYKQKTTAQKGIVSVATNAPDDRCFDRLTSTNGAPYFVLKARNGEIIGRSQMYASTSAMEKGIVSVKKSAPGARTVDLTG